MPSSPIPSTLPERRPLPGILQRLASFLALRLRRLRRGMPPEIKLDAVLAAMSDAVVISDRTGLFVDFNEPFAHLNRFKTKAECTVALADYTSIFEVSTVDGTIVPLQQWPIRRALAGESGVNIELKLRRKDTGERWTALYNYAPIRVDDGSIVGAVLTGRDITEFRKAEGQLKNLSSRLHLALTSAHLGVWEWDILHNKLSWDDRMFELYGMRREQLVDGFANWEATLHPDDRDAAVDLISAVLRGEKEFDTEFRVVHPDGQIRHLKANGLVLRGADGRPERMLGVNADITEEKFAKERLQSAYSEVEAKVVERTAQLESAKKAAEDASRAKDLFLATLSHELRTPLSAILSWTQLLERGLLSPEKTQTAVRTIKESVLAQNQLIGDLLDLSRISTGKLHIDRQPTEVDEVLKAAIDVIRPNAEQRGLKIEEHFDCRDVYISADPGRLKQSFWNILSNAVKFTQAGGTISVHLTCSEEAGQQRVKIAIRDTGKGVRPEFISQLFQRFSQADSSSIRTHGGMGLGLALVKSLVELQDGTVSAESAGEGLGTTFTLSFPLITSAVQGAMHQMAIPTPGKAPHPDGLSNMKVLLVEDGEKTRIALAQLLEAQGATVQASASAAEALEMFKGFRPDVIISDIAMPQEDGHSLIRKIRALGVERGGNTPAVALTAYAEPRDRDQAFASGFQEYLNKPVEAGLLADTIIKLAHARA